MDREHMRRPEKEAVFPRTTEYLGADIKNSAEVLGADELRREDDLRTAERQDEAEASQHEAERVLAESARRLDESGSALSGAQDQLAESRDRMEALRDDIETLRADTDDLSRDAQRDD